MFGISTLLVLSLAAGADLQTLSGKKIAGDIAGLDKQTLVLKTATGDQRIPVADVLQIDLGAQEPLPTTPYYDVELTDGSVFHCPTLAIKGANLVVTAQPDMALTIPLTAVYSVLRDAHDAKVRQDWQKFSAKRARFDVVGVRGADGQLNPLEGTFGVGTESGDGIEFTYQESGKKLTPKLSKVQGLLFVPRPAENAPQTLCKVTDAARNLVVSADILVNAEGVTLTSVAGVRVKYASSAKVARLDFSKGKLTYLSDLDPSKSGNAELSTEDGPSLGQFLAYRKNLNLNNGPLRLDGITYAKGVALHAGTQLVYEIGGDYKEFRVIVGVDESVQTESPVEVVIEGDGRVLAREAVNRRGKAKTVAVDVKGVQQLRVSVVSKELLELGGQANLCDAKVSK
ncbi:MAG: NPCBM/NEW2 domain-containing protein [Gemmataceae bacterium]